ncbi:MAG: hypothetical protein ACE5EM_12450 [Sphingomonadales bacterium]
MPPEPGSNLGGGMMLVMRLREPVTADLLAEVRARIPEFEAGLIPAERGYVLARIMALMEHFYVPDREQQVEKIIAGDWAEHLAEYPSWVIDDVVRRWLRGERKRPTIAEFRERCDSAVWRVRRDLRDMKRLLDVVADGDVA